MTRTLFLAALLATALPVLADPPMTKIRVEVRKAANDKAPCSCNSPRIAPWRLFNMLAKAPTACGNTGIS